MHHQQSNCMKWMAFLLLFRTPDFLMVQNGFLEKTWQHRRRPLKSETHQQRSGATFIQPTPVMGRRFREELVTHCLKQQRSGATFTVDRATSTSREVIWIFSLLRKCFNSLCFVQLIAFPSALPPSLFVTSLPFRFTMSLVKLIPDSCSMELPRTSITMNIGEHLASPIRSIPEVKGLDWIVHCCPAGRTEAQAGYISVFVTVLKPVDLRFTFSLKNTNITEQFFVNFNSDILSHGSPFFISHDLLRSCGAIQDGKFTIVCDVAVELPVSDFKAVPHIHELLHESCPQVTMLVEDEELQMNKAILMSVSPVFNAMFNHDTQEARSGCVKIDDFSYDTVDNVIDFILGSTSRKLTASEIIDMLKFADKYDISGLIVYFEAFLAKNVTPDNVADITTYAYAYSRDVLKAKCAKFVSKKVGKAVVASFAQLEPSLLVSLIKAAADRDS
uniref:BTB domain-containing protein n=1 Tax=Panagrellus redivivus TaxID=6233 RepID=A0A7E4VM17_PANRE